MDWNTWIHANLSKIKGIDRIKQAPYEKVRFGMRQFEFHFLIYPELGGFGKFVVYAYNVAEARAFLARDADFAAWCAQTDGAGVKGMPAGPISDNLAAIPAPAISGNLLDVLTHDQAIAPGRAQMRATLMALLAAPHSPIVL